MSKFRLLKYFFVIVILVSYAGLVIFSISSNNAKCKCNLATR